jgi:hypothetical protein
VEMDALLKAFQEFWRDNSSSYNRETSYVEADFQLLVSAFLQRVFNGGAEIAREYATGSKRVDICVTYKQSRYPLELKVKRDNSEKFMPEAMQQIKGYLNKLGLTEGWLLIFDYRISKKKPEPTDEENEGIVNLVEPDWTKRLFWETKQENGFTIHLVGM